ncbi:MAG TPA: ABC transporter permease [Gemmatimonadaceae bacterium]|nr:ABC transporter permease [Gemmatimonadaceae bacterium]
MRKLGAVFRREFAERVRTKWFLVATLLAPMLFGMLLLAPLWLASRSKPAADVDHIVIVDATGRGLGQQVALDLAGGLQGGEPRARVREVEPGELSQALPVAAREVRERGARGYLVLGADFVTRGTARYAGANATSSLDMQRLRRALRDQLTAHRLEGLGVDAREVRSITSLDIKLDAERLTREGAGERGSVTAAFAFLIAIVLYLTIFMYGQNVMRSIMDEKQTRVAEVVVSSVPASTLLAGKVLGVGAVGLTQMTLSLLASLAMFRARAPIMTALGLPNVPIDLPALAPGAAVLLLLYFLLGYLFYSALFAAIGALVNSEAEAQQVALPVALLLVLSAMFIQPVLMEPESTVARVMSMLPFSAPIMMPLRLSLVPVPAMDIALSVLLLLSGCYLAVVFAARLYRIGLLMYGQRPGVRQVLRWLHEAGR